jgi:hypothetical protein
MRYFIGFASVLALGLMGCSATTGTGGSGGNGAVGGDGGSGGGGMGGQGGTGGTLKCERAEDCDDKNECTEDSCNPANESCENTPVEDGAPCADARGGCYGGSCNFVPVTVTLGSKELVFDWSTDRCEDLDLPDQQARFVRAADGEVVLFDANAPTYYVSRGADFDSLVRDCDPSALVSADQQAPESYQNWEWIWAVYREGTSWHALIHNEFHDAVAPTCKVGDPSPANPCWYNSITYAVSTNDGRTFAKPGAPAHVVAPAPRVWTAPEPGDPPVYGYYVEGYFNPTHIVRGPDGYFYALMSVFPQSGADERGICVLRTDTLGSPESWRAWDGIGFNLQLASPYVTGSATPLCQLLPDMGRQTAGALTYNTYIERYMHVNEWGQWVDAQTLICGVYFTLSTDLIHWSDIQLIARAETGCEDTGGPGAPPMLDQARIQYPSIVDHDDASVNFEHPGRTAHLYYTRHNGGLDRDLVRVPMTFTLEE